MYCGFVCEETVMTSAIPSSTSNRDENGVYSWEKGVVDVNNIDESLANARDLGYTRLNHARVTAVAELGKYNDRDMYKIQVQSNGKFSLSLRRGGGDDDKVLDLSKYDAYLDELKKKYDPEGYKEETEREAEKLKNQDLLDTTAEGMYVKVYTIKNNKEILIADSSADPESDEYQNAKAILSGEYKATKGNYYIEVGTREGVDASDGVPYALQVMQGTSYRHDYVLRQSDSADTKNKEISTKKQEALYSVNNGSYMISAAYAAQIQAVRYDGAANMLASGYLNMASVTADKEDAAISTFSLLLNV